jgi:hypothetical protein
MLWPVEKLKPNIVRRLELFQRGVVTESELVSFVFGESAFTLVDNPRQWPEIVDALDAIPSSVLILLAYQAAKKALPGNRWEWPPIGGWGKDDSFTVFREANPLEADAMKRLHDWLTVRAASIQRAAE